MSWLPNLGGPGWIEDVLQVKITLNNKFQVKACNYFFELQLPCFTNLESISGIIHITAPPVSSACTSHPFKYH